MNDKARRTLYLVAGMYVFYLGVKLMIGFIQKSEGNPIVSLIGGVLFLAVGGWLIVDYIVKTVKAFQEKDTEPTEEIEEAEEEK